MNDRWNGLPSSQTATSAVAFRQNAAVPIGGTAPPQPFNPLGIPLGDDAAQHATIGRYFGQQAQGNGSTFVQCIYTAKEQINTRVTLLCEKTPGCCEYGCCPKDQLWMAGVYVLLAFVIIALIVGGLILVVCYHRSKGQQRKEEKMAYAYSGYGSQVGMYPGGYASYVGSTGGGPRY